jgi:uridine kinase
MDLVDRLVTTIEDLQATRARVLVAIDGPDAAGKTTLADALAVRLGEGVTRASADHFEHPAEVRTRDGRGGDTYYRDGFDHQTLRRVMLTPFACGADTVVTAWRDPLTDEHREVITTVPARAVLIVDGVFLQRPELQDVWTYIVYLTVEPAVTVQRAVTRDIAWSASIEDVKRGYATRYLPGQELYRHEVDPASRADLVVDNTDPERPIILG